jgi:hypothetical protein
VWSACRSCPGKDVGCGVVLERNALAGIVSERDCAWRAALDLAAIEARFVRQGEIGLRSIRFERLGAI